MSVDHGEVHKGTRIAMGGHRRRLAPDKVCEIATELTGCRFLGDLPFHDALGSSEATLRHHGAAASCLAEYERRHTCGRRTSLG